MLEIYIFISPYTLFNIQSLLQTVRVEDRWEDWVLYMLEAVEQAAVQTIATIQAIKTALQDYKHRIRAEYKFYSQDLINNLFGSSGKSVGDF